MGKGEGQKYVLTGSNNSTERKKKIFNIKQQKDIKEMELKMEQKMIS